VPVDHQETLLINALEERQVICPYCGEAIDVLIDSSVAEQHYIEDCQVCCRPINFMVSLDLDDQVIVRVAHEDE
jgi:hypothetical protein